MMLIFLRVLVGALLLASGTIAEARWQEAESPHFRVFSTGSPAELKKMTLLLEDYDALLRLLTATKAAPSPNKLEVYLVGGLGDLRTVRNVPSQVAGFYSARPGGIVALSIRRDGWGLEARRCYSTNMRITS